MASTPSLIPPDLESLPRDELIALVLTLAQIIDAQAARLEELQAAARRAAPYSRRKRKEHPKRPGRKPGQGRFSRRGPPSPDEVTHREKSERPTVCSKCGSTHLEHRPSEQVSITDMPPLPRPLVKLIEMLQAQCCDCGHLERGYHPEIPDDQRGATAHRLGPRVKAAWLVLFYGWGIPERKIPAILEALTGITVTQGAISQQAVRGAAAGPARERYEELRASFRDAPVTHTDDTGWRINGRPAQLMVFATPDDPKREPVTVYQLRYQHRNEEVREILPADYQGVMVTDRGRSYDAQELSAVKKQKCITHVLRSIDEVLSTKKGAARDFGTALKAQLKEGLDLWNALHRGAIRRSEFAERASKLDARIEMQLAPRRFVDTDNQRLLDELGRHHDEGSLTRFLLDPSIPPTNNFGEREVRPAVIARKVSHCSMTDSGARARECYTSVIRTEARACPSSLIEAVVKRLFSPPTQPPH